MPDEEERHREAAGGGARGWSDPDHPDVTWAQVSAPDDISELARDIQAYRREQRAARRRERYGRFTLGPTAAPLTLTVAALAVVAIVATLLTVVGPRSTASPSALPLATTTVADGVPGGLLPAVTLPDAANGSVALRDLRPAVIAIVPPGCGCSDQVQATATTAGTHNVAVYAIVPPDQRADTDSLSGRLMPRAILSDIGSTVEKAVHPSALTLVFVNRNGTIYRVVPGADAVDTQQQLPATLAAMLGTGG